MKIKMAYFFALMLILFPWGCKQSPNQDGDFRGYRPYRNDPVISLSKAPREGWATDPNLSYYMYGYWPMNFYNNNIYQTMGIYGLPYR